ncbi:hypothetical protein D0Z00_004292 [Geotrichum galactomycetum]|uniref:Uncharacterized protein n=1 Tax=Geotrichum galactomycetum TaxID=27317 RepID=A0ACB6UYU9_9ASCO|nr:hypothetical protein D0Z00_004292 [Geotrichum candidum]
MEAADIRAELSRKASEKSEILSRYQEAERTQVDIKNQVRTSTKDISRVKKAYDEEKARLSGGYNEERKAEVKKLEESESLSKVISEKLARNEAQIDELSSALSTISPEEERIQTQIRIHDREISELKKGIDEVRRIQNNKLAAFGENTMAVVAAINKIASRFKSKPIGPIGQHVTLKDPKWRFILNKQLQGSLTAFIVENAEDRKLILKIFEQYRTSYPIILSKKDLFDYESSLPDKQYTTVLDVLEISDEHVKRVLIDQNKIESTILIENRREAEQLMYTRPRNVIQCYAITKGSDGCIIGGGDKNASGSTPIFGIMNSYMQISSGQADNTSVLQDRLADAHKARKSVGDSQSSLMTRKHSLRKELETRQRAVEAYRDKLAKLRSDIRKSKDILNEEIDDSRLTALESELEELELSKSQYEQQLTDSMIMLEDIDAEIKAVGKLVREIQTRFERKQGDVRAIEDKINSLENERARKQGYIDEAKAEEQKHKAEITKYETSMAEMKREISSGLEKATKFIKERPEFGPEETFETLLNQFKEVQAKLQEMQRYQSKSLAEITREFQIAQTNFHDGEKQYKKSKAVLSHLKMLQNSHQSNYQHFLNVATMSIYQEFTRILRERSFEGKLNINHNKKIVELSAAPRNEYLAERSKGKTRADAGRDTKTLSGGEKSFSQIAFLLSVWKVINCRIRGLDEFDVFMDEVNRKVSMKLMIEAIKSSNNSQTIFITPNNMADMNVQDDDVKINLMADAR